MKPDQHFKKWIVLTLIIPAVKYVSLIRSPKQTRTFEILLLQRYLECSTYALFSRLFLRRSKIVKPNFKMVVISVVPTVEVTFKGVFILIWKLQNLLKQ